LDIAGRGAVDIVDYGIIASSFNSRIGSSKYNAAADLTGGGVIDIIDITLLSAFFNALDFS
jgi:hypothetical protein